jgi:hypothetical protein
VFGVALHESSEFSDFDVPTAADTHDGELAAEMRVSHGAVAEPAFLASALEGSNLREGGDDGVRARHTPRYTTRVTYKFGAKRLDCPKFFSVGPVSAEG